MKKTNPLNLVCKGVSAIAFMLIPASACLAQSELPIIKATSVNVRIFEDNHLSENDWTIVPEAKPDICYTRAKRVTFYTDIDSITFKVKPKVGEYNFVVLLNGKDSAYTQIKYAEPEPSYLKVLKKAKKYNPSDKRFVPNFVYESPENESLKALRSKYKLDSIAGQGTELSKIINLLYWVHNTIRHDGNSDSPKERNAEALIELCKKENRGVNCRMMAIILNECYLSMGIKSNFVTCMPKETEFQDCHVINSVYSSDLKKWIWIDPTFAAYVMDEKGEMQGIAEVREKLISGKTLILNPDANWNHESTQIKEYYLDQYMAKNLYRLEAALYSTPNLETYGFLPERAYLELLPLDGIVQTPQCNTSEWPNKVGTGVLKFTSYKTNNPAVFWALPKQEEGATK